MKTPLIENDHIENLNVVFTGHVDHGKSTVIGRLLADSDSLPKGKLEQVRESCERSGIDFEYAYLIDALKDERSQNITIDSARVFFKSTQRQYSIIDAPGHIEFVKNMVSGAARAEAAILVIDAQEGVQENSRRHGYLLWMLGIKTIILMINKMDLVNFDEKVFQHVRDTYLHFLDGINIVPYAVIPASGSTGANIVHKAANMSWYNGKPLLEVLDTLQKDGKPQNEAFRMPVQDVYKFTEFGDKRRIVTGRITNGELHIGDEVVFYPSGKRSTVKSIEGFNHPTQSTVVQGQSCGFTLAEQIYVRRGELAARADQAAPIVSRHFRASLFWLGKSPLSLHKVYFLKIGTSKVRMQVKKVLKVIDAASLEEQGEHNQVGRHQVAECLFSTHHPIAFDLTENLTETSRFVIVDNFEISGGGIIIESIRDEEAAVHDSVYVRNQRWIKSLITPSQRAEVYNQRAAMLIITGKRGAGRKRTANQLELSLFQSGKKVYFLGIGSVLYGVDADINEKEGEEVRREHIRRFAEVSHILLEAGLILIVTAIELTRQDIKLIRTVVGDERIQTVWLGEEITTDIQPDLHLVDDEVNHSVIQILQMMRETGIIFTP